MSQFSINKASLTEYIKSQNWHFRVERDNEDSYVVSLGMNLNCRLNSCRILVSASATEIQAYTVSPINANSKDYSNVVEYITRANYGLKVGGFEFDYSDGEIRYHTCHSSKEGIPSQSDVERIVDVGVLMMERYGDGLVKNLMGFGNPAQDIEEAEK